MGFDVAQTVSGYSGTIADAAISFAPAIPPKALRAALRSYARGVHAERVLLLINTTSGWFGATTGLLVTDTDLHAHYKGRLNVHIELSRLKEVLLVEPHSLHLNDQPGLLLPGRSADLLRKLWTLFSELALGCNREHAIAHSIAVSNCLTCRDTMLWPLLALQKSPGARREPHRLLMECENCERVQLDYRDAALEGGAVAFDAADSLRLVESARRCPDRLSAECGCALHAALREHAPLPAAMEREPDTCLHDLPRLGLGEEGGLPRIRLRSGRVATAYHDGKPKAEGELAEGLCVGRWTLWHEAGAKKAEGDYRLDRREGRWLEWRQDGEIAFDRVWRGGYTD